MRMVKFLSILAVGSSIILWIRAGDGFHIAKAFPLLGGYGPGKYDIAAAILCVIAYVGWRRLR